MMRRKNAWLMISILLTLGLAACGEAPDDGVGTPETESTCTDSKCDDFGATQVDLLADLELQILDSDPDEGIETIQIIGIIDDTLRELVPWCTHQSCGARSGAAHELNVAIWASDGMSNPDYKIEDRIVLDRTVGPNDGEIDPEAKYEIPVEWVYDDEEGYIEVEGIEVDLLPWQQITVQITGELMSNRTVEQTFVFNLADCEANGELTSCIPHVSVAQGTY